MFNIVEHRPAKMLVFMQAVISPKEEYAEDNMIGSSEITSQEAQYI